jgi:threonylcarbamoyladenosine tRNA methylthiotransferase MtaB
LQSGCDSVLKKMNRRYTAREYAKAADALRKIKEDTALTTDIIVGFPGESDSDFQESLDFVREMKFANVHVFEFSPREGTPAAEFQQVSHKVKTERGKAMRNLSSELRTEFLNSQIGKTLNVLFEGAVTGHSGNYCEVKVQSEEHLKNTIKKVKITNCVGEHLTGFIQGSE